MSLTTEHNEFYYIFFREVQSEGDLEADVINERTEVRNIRDLLSDVHDNVEYTHSLNQLDVKSYFIDWVDSILSTADSFDEEVDSEGKTYLRYIAEDFSDSMKSRARERGKYVVLIVSRDSLRVCHSFTGKKALTTDMNVIEELLSEANIDKYAYFTYDDSGSIIVQHFDRHDTESFTEWLGIPEDEIAFEIKGNVRVHTKIDGIDAVFELDQDDITSKLLGSDDYDLADGMLKTPNEDPRRVERIRWGHRPFTNVEEFKQELFKVNHNLTRAFEMHDKEISDSLDSFFTVIDYRDKIVKGTGDDTVEKRKPKVDFELPFVNNQVEMNLSWRTELRQKFLSKHDPIPICHAGGEFSESPFALGNFRIYNEVRLTETQERYIIDLMETTNDLGTANLQPLFCHITFELLFRNTPKPLRYLFREFSEEFQSKFLGSVDDGTRIIQTEGEEIDLEYKSPPWFDRKSDAEDIAEGIHREFQNSRLVLLGINEDAKGVDVIDSGVTSEKALDIEEHLEEDYGVEEAHVWPLPIEDGHGIVALNVSSPEKPFQADITFLETSQQEE